MDSSGCSGGTTDYTDFRRFVGPNATDLCQRRRSSLKDASRFFNGAAGCLTLEWRLSSRPGNLLAVQNRDGVLALVDLKSMSPLADLKLGSPLKLAQFSADGNRLLVVTADQMVRLIETQALRH